MPVLLFSYFTLLALLICQIVLLAKKKVPMRSFPYEKMVQDISYGT
jgi:hypothetical protein